MEEQERSLSNIDSQVGLWWKSLKFLARNALDCFKQSLMAYSGGKLKNLTTKGK